MGLSRVREHVHYCGGVGAPTPRAGGLQFYANVTAPIVGLAPTKTSRQSIGTEKGALSDRRREITYMLRVLSCHRHHPCRHFLCCHHLRCRHYCACNHHCCRHCHFLRTLFALCPPLMSLLSDLDVVWIYSYLFALCPPLQLIAPSSDVPFV